MVVAPVLMMRVSVFATSVSTAELPLKPAIVVRPGTVVPTCLLKATLMLLQSTETQTLARDRQRE